MKNYLLAVEIGGTKLQVALGMTDGKIVAVERGNVDPARGAEGILAWLETATSAVIGRCPADGTCRAIGVGFGGPVDSATGRVLVSHQVGGWDGVHLKRWFDSRPLRTGCPAAKWGLDPTSAGSAA